MENREKAVNLFKYILELYAQKTKIIEDVTKQKWYKFIDELPNDSDNIQLNYFDRTSNSDDMGEDLGVILQVKKPEFDRCPQLPNQLNEWISYPWDRFDRDVEVIEVLKKNINNSYSIEYFEEDATRIKMYNDWIERRKAWVVAQQKIHKTRTLFTELYQLYIDLERDSETIELVVGQGVLNCEMNTKKKVYHPLITKRISVLFDSTNNIISLIDTNASLEIYTMLLQGVEDINHSSIRYLNDELVANDYHPLDRNETPDFLRKMAHTLHSESKYQEDYKSKVQWNDRLTIFNRPVFFVRKRTGGVIKALEDIINQIDETGELSGPLLNLIGENVPQLVEAEEFLELSQSLAALSGEDKDVLLSKEANREQLEIAKRIENYNAVLVQGPPGTGKTHTIANLMGHFLAQGKNILVTSHTKKALQVVKEKVVPELQNLCVAVLDDNSKDMEKSVDGITEYISAHNSLELFDKSNELKNQREVLLSELSSVRKKIFAIKNKEYETINCGGVGYSVAEAARYVNDNAENLAYIPGVVKLNRPLPIAVSELELLYLTNEKVTVMDEQELDAMLPNPIDLLIPEEFKELIEKKDSCVANVKQSCNKSDKVIEVDLVTLTMVVENENMCKLYDAKRVGAFRRNISINALQTESLKEWELNAILAGKQGGGFVAVWENLVREIKSIYDFSGQIAGITLGKQILIEESMIVENTIRILEEIKIPLENGKKIKPITLLIHKEWKEIVSGITVNSNELATADDVNAAIASIRLNLLRRHLKNVWWQLIEQHGGVSFADFGEQPELSCISFIARIEQCLSWHINIYEKYKREFLALGFSKKCLNSNEQFIDPREEIKLEIKFMGVDVPNYIDLADIIYGTMPDISVKINKLKKVKNLNNKKSMVCKHMLAAIESENCDLYAQYYLVLQGLYQKYYYQEKRTQLLSDLSKSAPEWATQIENRIGIHGLSQIPDKIEEAWRWKQFARAIDEITEQPFEQLQHKSIVLNKQLQKLTSKLAETLSWYYLLIRIEGNISQKQALQGWKLTTKKIGKGTGKMAPKLKKEAQKLMAECQSAVPAWIMPVNKALENLDPTKNKFDIVIIDEASQSDISALAIMYLAKKIIIVGDDEQVSPSAVGMEVDKMLNLTEMYIKDNIPNYHLYDMKSSLYDIAKTTFPTLMLKEHFRCVPDIIGYSNRLSYDYRIKPLRDDSNVPIKPATIAYKVEGERHSTQKINKTEAENIVALLLSCMAQKEYKGMTFGVISLLGDAQATLINKIALEKIAPQEYEKRKILCGNASHFQGDERDVIFLSLVDSNEGEGPLRITGEGVGNATKQRYNVAVSRAKNQLWVVHSLDINNDLKAGDMRKMLIEYAMNPTNFEQKDAMIKANADSPFEISVARELVKQGYHIVQQWPVGSYRIDMVAVCGDKKIAIECDGELYHSGVNKVREDMERQTILERLGWKFIRIRGSEYYRNSGETMKRVINELVDNEIQPEESTGITVRSGSDLQQKIMAMANNILDEWHEENENEN